MVSMRLALAVVCLLALLPAAGARADGNVTVGTAPTSGGAFSGGSPNVFSPTGTADAILNGDDLTAALASTPVVIEAPGDITIASSGGGPGVHGLELRPGGRTQVDALVLVEGPLTFNGATVINAPGLIAPQQTYAGPLTIQTSTTLSSTGLVHVQGAVSGAALEISGDAQFDGNVGNPILGRVASLTVRGDTTLHGGVGVFTNQAQSFRGDLDLDVSTTLNGGLLQVAGAVNLGPHTLTVETPDGLISGGLTGNGNLESIGRGNLTLAGHSTFTGSTQVHRPDLSPVGGDYILTIASDDALGATSGVRVGDGATLALSDADVASVPVSLQTDAIGTATLTGTDSSWGGDVTIGGDPDFDPGVVLGADGPLGFTVSGAISGGVIVHSGGSGQLSLTGANSYDDDDAEFDTVVDSGTLRAANPSALGPGSVSVSPGATLRVDTSSLANPLTIGGSGVGGGGALVATSPATLTSDLTLASTGAVRTTSPLSLAGGVDGPGGLTKQGAGTLTLPGGGGYGGPTTIAGGTLQLAGDEAIPNGSRTHADGTLAVGGATQHLPALTGGGALDLGSGSLTVSPKLSEAFQGTIAGNGELVKDGPGTFTLNTTVNLTTGTTRIDGGTLRAARTGALSRFSPVVLANAAGARLDLAGTAQIVPNLSGGGPAGGDIVLGSGSLATNGDGSSTSYGGALSGTGELVKAGPGTLTLSGHNVYTGTTSIEDGTLLAGAPGALAPGSAFSVGVDTTLDLDGLDQTVGSLAGAGDVTLGAGTLTTGGAADTTFSGSISGSGGLVKAGSGAFTLPGTATYSGPTTVRGGQLRVGGELASSVRLDGGTLRGTGTIGELTQLSGGAVAPGESPGILHTASAGLGAETTYQLELAGSSAGGGYDQLDVQGIVALQNARLAPSVEFSPAVGEQFTIVANDGTEPVIGAFAGLPQGAELDGDEVDLRVDYAGGDGNDVVLTRLSPTSTALSASAAAVAPGTPLTLVAAVGAEPPGSGSPAGTVSFLDGAGVLGSAPVVGGSASLTASGLGLGAHAISARYAGAGPFAGSSSRPLTVTVEAPPTPPTPPLQPALPLVRPSNAFRFPRLRVAANGTVRFVFAFPRAGRLVARLTARGRPARTIGLARARAGRARRTAVAVRLNRVGRRLLRRQVRRPGRRGRLGARLALTFTPGGGLPNTRSRALTIRPHRR
jgi:autotransporter-associated beta strand protein